MMTLEEHIALITKVHGSHLTHEEILREATWRFEKEKTILKGDDVVHLKYIDGVLRQEDLEEIRVMLSRHQLRLSSYDKAGDQMNFLEEFGGTVEVFLDAKFVQDLTTELLGGFLWDSIKHLVLSTYQKIKGKKVATHFAGGSVQEHEATLILKTITQDGARFDLQLRGEVVTEQLANASLDQFMEIVRDSPSGHPAERAKLYRADVSTGGVAYVDTQAIIRQRAEEQWKSMKKAEKKHNNKKDKKKDKMNDKKKGNKENKDKKKKKGEKKNKKKDK